MKTIYKYPVKIEDEFNLQLPYGAKLLTVQRQIHETQIWFEVDTEAPLVDVNFILVGTGHEIRLNNYTEAIYCGTFQLAGGTLILHLYKRIK